MGSTAGAGHAWKRSFLVHDLGIECEFCSIGRIDRLRCAVGVVLGPTTLVDPFSRSWGRIGSGELGRSLEVRFRGIFSKPVEVFVKSLPLQLWQVKCYWGAGIEVFAEKIVTSEMVFGQIY